MDGAKWNGPTRAQVAAVAAVFSQLAKDNHAVDMGEAEVIQNDECGTIACHAGWYEYAAACIGGGIMAPTEDNCFYYDSEPVYVHRKDGSKIHYENGAGRMARDLGFAQRGGLAAFAYEHPEWWGNAHGDAMFGNRNAFGVTAPGRITLDDIAQHWRGVAERTPA